MIVIKLGGSLMTSGKLLPCLEKIGQCYADKNTVIVPGGGLFADQVRISQQQWQFDDRSAHQMALLAMKQSALLIKALKPEFTLFDSVAEFLKLKAGNRIAIWSPEIAELDNAGIPSSWNVTSDSLSVWLAESLLAEELIVVKSVKIEADFDILKLVQDQVVDASFIEYTQHAAVKVNIVHAENFIA
jgi:5-(aminomethyl)-3-furanmethanol phosphate kinase